MYKLSIVIPSYNTKDLLRNCLKSIYNSGNLHEIEIIVVDNASADGSGEMVGKEFPSVKLIANKKNLGFAVAVNQGWKSSIGELILFLNSDTELRSKDIAIRILKYFSEDESAGALSGKLKLRSGRIDPDIHRGFPTPWSSFTFFLGFEKLFPKSRIFGQYHQGWKDLNTVHEIDAGCGAFLAVRRKILEEICGWDENYFFYGEDIDLCFRIKEKGWKIIYYPHIDVLHYKGASSGLRKESRDLAKNKKDNLVKVAGASVKAWERFYKKFYEGRYPGIITGLVLTGIRLKGFVRITKYKLLGS